MNVRLVGCIGCALAACAITAGTVRASQQEKTPHSDAFEKCQESAETTQGSIECYVAESKHWDARLNKAYQALIKAYEQDDEEEPLVNATPGTTRVALLRTAQRAWLTFRQADCKSHASAADGSAGRIIAAQCDLEHLADRTVVLEQLLTDRGR